MLVLFIFYTAFLKMVPLVSKSVATLLDIFAEQAASGETIEMYRYSFINFMYPMSL